jgi:hypothetical protein
MDNFCEIEKQELKLLIALILHSVLFHSALLLFFELLQWS